VSSISSPLYDVSGDPARIPLSQSGTFDLQKAIEEGRVQVARFDIDFGCLSPAEICDAVAAYAKTPGGRAACKQLERHPLGGNTWNVVPVARCGGNGQGNVMANVVSQNLFTVALGQSGWRFIHTARFQTYQMQNLVDDLRRVAPVSRFGGGGALPTSTEIQEAESYLLKLSVAAQLTVATRNNYSFARDLAKSPLKEPRQIPAPPDAPEPARKGMKVDASEAAGELATGVHLVAAQGPDTGELVAYLGQVVWDQRVEQVLFQYFYHPMAVVLAQEWRIAAEAALPSTLLVNQTQITNELNRLQEEMERQCEDRNSLHMSNSLGQHACTARPRLMVGATRTEVASRKVVNTIEAVTLRKQFWESGIGYAGKNFSPLPPTGNWRRQGAPVIAQNLRPINNPGILHFRPRDLEWWTADGWRYGTAGSADCPTPGVTTGPLSCDEYPYASSYEGGPELNQKPSAWTRGIPSGDNCAEGCVYSGFIVFTDLRTAFTALVANAKELRTVVAHQLPSISFYNNPSTVLPSMGFKFVNNKWVSKQL
jgi:hypothetical protein